MSTSMKFSLAALIALAVLGVALAACSNAVRPAVFEPVQPERAQECRANCDRLGMRLSSVVLIMNHAGCVCEVKDAAPAPATTPAAAAASGAATIAYVLQAAAQQQQNQQQQRRSQQPSYNPTRR